MSYRQILLAVDLAEDSAIIGRKAANLANTFSAGVNLLHVVEYVPMDPAGEAMMAPPVDLERELLESARQRLAEFASRINLEEAPRDVTFGNIKSEIVRAAEETDTDLIVLGRHQHHGLALLTGSTERSLMNAAPCDVLAIRVADDQP